MQPLLHWATTALTKRKQTYVTFCFYCRRTFRRLIYPRCREAHIEREKGKKPWSKRKTSSKTCAPRCCSTMNINTQITRRRNSPKKINLSARREMDHFSRHLTLGVTCALRRRRYLLRTWVECNTCDAELAVVYSFRILFAVSLLSGDAKLGTQERVKVIRVS